ncbi:hypothetical protein K8I28_01000, partial [bacterium]|nr:hypothetical protein [bacterium]
ILVHEGEMVTAGERLCEGSVSPQDILAVLGPSKVQEYLVNEIQEVYRLQGVRIADKHIEVIVRQMMQRVRIEDPGDTRYLEGDHVDVSKLKRVNRDMQGLMVVEGIGDSRFMEEQLVDRAEVNREIRRLKKLDLQSPSVRPAQPALYQPLLLGITQASLSTESFISAASFQETTRVLTEAAIERKTDDLIGLKENVIMGHLIPAGTGLRDYQNLTVVNKDEEEREQIEREQAEWLAREAERARQEAEEYADQEHQDEYNYMDDMPVIAEEDEIAESSIDDEDESSDDVDMTEVAESDDNSVEADSSDEMDEEKDTADSKNIMSSDDEGKKDLSAPDSE